MGDSRGHWDGDTLVVETVNIDQRNTIRPTGAQSFYLGRNPKITERFTRVSEQEMLYEFQVEEPTAFAQPWRAEMPMLKTNGPIYEYACYEGNYALPGMLAGARKFDAQGKSSTLTYYATQPRLERPAAAFSPGFDPLPRGLLRCAAVQLTHALGGAGFG